MKWIVPFLIVTWLVLPSFAQDDNRPLFSNLEEFQTALNEAVASGDIESFWNQIVEAGQMPLIFRDTVVFLHREHATSVEWRGDFNGWASTTDYFGEQQGETDLWVLIKQFPLDARLDYKIVLNQEVWILDPLNPYQQVGGFGPNSELRMPDYEYPTVTIPRDDIEKGIRSEVLAIDSELLGYEVRYRVYTPVNYAELENLPVIYVTDGHEYANPDMGSMVIVLDNLIADGLIEPVVAVFIDPRASSGVNRREREYITNDKFTGFLTTELVPKIDATYKTNPSPEARAILGTSLGGLNSAYVGLHHSDVFQLIAIQSPAFWVAPQVIEAYAQRNDLPLTVFMSVGLIGDDVENTQEMRTIFEANEYPMLYLEVNEGHSWGNWRALLDDMLLFFFGVE